MLCSRGDWRRREDTPVLGWQMWGWGPLRLPVRTAVTSLSWVILAGPGPMPCQPWLSLDLGLGSVPQEQACVASRGGWRAQGDGFVLCDDGGSQMGDEIDLQTEGRRVSVATLMQPERIPLFTAHLSGTVILSTLEQGGLWLPRARPQASAGQYVTVTHIGLGVSAYPAIGSRGS